MKESLRGAGSFMERRMTTERNAIISVHDKRGIAEFAAGLAAQGITIFASGGTFALLEKERIPARRIEDHTKFPEMLGGRVKTLHPLIHGGILAKRDDPAHLAETVRHGIALFDLVVVNLYPFEETVARGASPAEIVENIDIGGPSMIRSAAKNHAAVTVVTSPDDYPTVLEELKNNGGTTTPETRRALATKAFALTARYDGAVAAWLSGSDIMTIQFSRKETLRYGENPHQRGTLYLDTPAVAGTIATARQLGGKELSFNNYLDLEAAKNLVFDLDEPACAILKHTNPCGAARGATIAEAYERALACDPVSAFGSIIGFNRPVDVATATLLSKLFVEAIVAPAFDEAALEILRRKKNLRIIELGAPRRDIPYDHEFKKISGGLLVEDADRRVIGPDDLRIVTRRAPTEEEKRMMLFGQRIVKHIKSNAVALTTANELVGVGAGQMSRIDALEIAVRKTRRDIAGLALASDAFFPFRDSIDLAASKGIRAIVQPGGSVRDEEVIAACDEHGIAMAFTGIRSFRHL